MTLAKAAAAASDQDIYDRIFAAVLDRRLRPGAHLREVELAQMFGVSRTKVRQALAKLMQVGVVEARPNRGAAVAAPTRRQARELFELRRMLEPAITAKLAERRSPQQIARLRAHIGKESEARASRDEAALIRATGEFHLLLAGMLGNGQIDALMQELEALTCLAILSYAHAETFACLPHEHDAILEAVVAGDAEAARTLMATHLDHVRDDLDIQDREAPSQELSAILGFAAPRPAAAGRRPKKSAV